MPIENIPFTSIGGGIYRPYLSVKIINPHTGKWLKTVGLIDSGADDCAVPATYALMLGHNLSAGAMKTISTGNGRTMAYSHTTKFEILNPANESVLYTVDDTPIDCLLNLHIVLLGATHFLNEFILTVNYPKHIFSIKYP